MALNDINVCIYMDVLFQVFFVSCFVYKRILYM